MMEKRRSKERVAMHPPPLPRMDLVTESGKKKRSLIKNPRRKKNPALLS